jgi:ParB/RepB/Spo0J family partition protein
MKTENQNIQLDTKNLKSNPVNLQVYGEEGPDYRLVDSIKEKGQLEPLVVIEDKEVPGDYIIVSGHRRWTALKKLRRKASCRLVSFEDELEMKEAIIEYNKYRNKTPSQMVNEANLLRSIYAEKAEKRKIATLKQNADVQNSAQREELKNDTGKTRDKVADAVGIGRDKLEKFTKIKEKADNGDDEAKILMQKLDDEEITANRAITYLELIEAARLDTPEKNYAIKLLYQVQKDKITPHKAIINLNNLRKKIQASEEIKECRYKGKYPVLFADFSESFPPLEDYMHQNIPSQGCSVLCILTTPKFLKNSLDVIDWFGFEYKAMCIWDRSIKSSNTWFIGSCELLVLGTKKDINVPHAENHFPCIIKDKNAHKCVHEMIPKMFPNQNYIDLFPKEEPEGWDQWVLDVKSRNKESIESKLNKLFDELDQNESIKRIIMSKNKQDATQDVFEEWY